MQVEARMSMYGSPAGGVLEQDVPKAHQACLSCRKQKRKCNKALPACALCERMGRLCDYSEITPAPTSDDFNALRQKLLELERRLNTNNGVPMDGQPYMSTPAASTVVSGAVDSVGATPNTVYIQHDPAYQNIQNRFPSIAFLDSEAFQYGQVVVPKPAVDIPVEVLELLGDGSAIQAVITDYFDTAHNWLPIISKKRMTRNMLNPLWEAGPDLALLFLCMKLMVTRPQDGIDCATHPIYMAAKRFLSLLEASGVTSLLLLQAYLLITTYEIGQAIYPAAWMSAGACARYAQLLGIHGHQTAPKILGHAGTWTEVEERKRTWWAVVIVDRIVSVGGKGRYLACEEPADDMILPVPTSDWDEGAVGTHPALTAAAALEETLDTYARMCQASAYLGKVIRHHLDVSMPESQRFCEASELHNVLTELARRIAQDVEHTPDRYLLHSVPMALCFSALCCLCDTYACHMPNAATSAEAATMQIQAVEGIKTVSASIRAFAEQIIDHTQHSMDIDKTSPFIMDSLYAAAANFAWLVRESGADECQIALESIRHCLRKLGSRWRCAAEYLRILEAQEFTYALSTA